MNRKQELEVLIAHQRKYVQKISDQVADTVDPHDMECIKELKKATRVLEGQIKEYQSLLCT